MNKYLKYLIVLLSIILTGAIGYFLYYYWSVYNDEIKKSEELKNEIGVKEESLNNAKKADGECKSNFSEGEIETYENWDTYSSSSYHYTFKYPSDWTLDASSPDMVNVKDDDNESFFIYSGEKAVMGFSEYDLLKSDKVTISCQSVNRSYFSSDNNQREIVASFEVDSITHTLFFSYVYEGASQAKGSEELADLIFKTINF